MYALYMGNGLTTCLKHNSPALIHQVYKRRDLGEDQEVSPIDDKQTSFE